MTRQNFLQLALSLSVAGGALLLDGCGGGGGNSGSGPGTTMTRGRLALPSGSSAGMRVLNGFGDSAVSADGGFGVKALKNVPSIALVLDPAGKLALLGFVDPAASDNTLDAMSAAVAFLFLAIGGAQASIDDKPGLLRELRAEPAVATLAATIAARLTADPLALHNGDAQIQAALVSARDAVRSAHGGSRRQPIPGITPVTRAQAPSRMLVQPSGQQSGVEVVQDPTRDGAIVPINHRRRWGRLYAYRVGFEDASGSRRDLPLAEPLNKGDLFTATLPLGGVFTTLEELFVGSAAFAPVTGSSLALTMKEGDAKAFVEVVAVGSAFTQSEPEFFSAPRYAGQAALWREDRYTLNLVSFLEILFGLLLESLGIRGTVANFAAYEAAALAWASIDELALKSIVAKAKSGQLPTAIADLVKLGLKEGEGLVILRQLAAKSQVLASYIAGETVVLTETVMAAGWRAMGGLLLFAPGVVMGAVDLGAIVRDLSTANAADLWTATLIKPTVTISPSATTLGMGQELTLSASVPGAADGAKFSYAWTLSGSNLASLRGDGKTGMSIETTGSSVALTTTPSTQGTLTVTVKAYQLGEGGSKSLVGEAKSAVTMADRPQFEVVSEFVPSGINKGTTSFFIAWDIRADAASYTITIPGNVYLILSRDIGQPVPEGTILNSSAPQVFVRQREGTRYANLVFRRGNQLYWSVVTTTPGPASGGLGNTVEEVKQWVRNNWLYEGGFAVTVQTR